VARLFRTLVSAVAAAFLIVSPGHAQVRQGSEPESARQNQSEPEHRVQSLVGTWKLLEGRAFDDAGHELPQPLGPHPMGIAVIEFEGKDRFVATPISGLVGQNAGLRFVWERVR
jgi:hypothetical protein